MTQEILARSPIETRDAGGITEVDFPQRTIELIVMPYDQPTTVEYEGRMIQEVCARGAYDGIERRANRVRVNYHHQDHELRHLLGRAVAFYPNRDEGLVAKLRIDNGGEGDLALEKAANGSLGASAGFGVMKDGVTWPTRNLRRLTKLFLDHVALTPTPAYPGAEVLAVRAHADPVGDRVPTPNLDEVRGWMLEDQFLRSGRPNG